MDTEKIICKQCGTPKPENEFYTNRTAGKEYRKKVCSTCDNKKRGKRRVRSYAHRCLDPLFKQKASAWQKKYRSDPKNVAALIYKDSRKGDKKLGRDNDLDRAWIKETIADGCSYCGETELRMTLDRMDNTKGHTKDNVRAACIRCNFIRRAMPFSAWLCIVNGMREAREQGAFGDWVGSIWRG